MVCRKQRRPSMTIAVQRALTIISHCTTRDQGLVNEGMCCSQLGDPLNCDRTITIRNENQSQVSMLEGDDYVQFSVDIQSRISNFLHILVQIY